MKTFKFTVILILLMALVVKPSKIAKSTCSGGDVGPWSYEFFTPMSFESMSNFEWEQDNSQPDNVGEWKAYFQNKPTDEDIKKVVYEVSADDMQKIRNYVEKGSSSISADLKNNSLVKYWQTNKDLNTIDYLFYAKACEAQAGEYAGWNEPERDMEKTKWLADAGKKYYNEKGSNMTLKIRFAYQAIRMAHYSKQYQKAIQLYDELVAPLFTQTESIIRYWALAHKAGALQGLKKDAESAYWFAVVFDQCPSRRTSSFLSIEIGSDETWTKALGFCKNEEEKASLYFIRSLQPNSRILNEMKTVYGITPHSEKLSMMLVREINKLENILLNIDLSKNLLFFTSYTTFPDKEATKELTDLKNFVAQVQRENKTEKSELWSLALGYVDYMIGNDKNALSTFAELKKATKNDKFKKQIEVFEKAIQVSKLQTIDETSEEQIYQAVKATGHEQLKDFMINAFERLYRKQSDFGKAYLCKKTLNDLKYYPELNVVEQMLVLANKPKFTSFEKEYLLPRIYESNEKDNQAAKYALLEMKATLLFREDRLKEAVEVYQQIPANHLYKIENDPFQATMQDCYENCPPSQSAGKYNRMTLAQKMLALQDAVKQNTVERAKFYFDLGNAYYNISYFGNSWGAIDYFRSSSDMWSYKEGLKNPKDNAYPTDAQVNMNKAKYYFDRAMGEAFSNSNTELAAQSCFMASKCEQNQYYLNPDLDSWGYIDPTYKPELRTYFTRLKKEYKNTKFYKEAIKECSYFNVFVNIN
jgi:hypothetical protein